MRLLFTSFFFCFFNLAATCQTELNYWLNLKLGGSFEAINSKLQNKFGRSGEIAKGDYLKSYLIKYENVDLYNRKADITLKFIQNKLVNIEISFIFYSVNPLDDNYRYEFPHVYKVINNDIRLNLPIVEKTGLLNEEILEASLYDSCINIKTEEEYGKLKSKIIGASAFFINKKKYPDSKFIMLSASLYVSKQTIRHGNNDTRITFMGCVHDLTIFITNAEMDKLDMKYSDAENRYVYKASNKEVKLNRVNDVFYIPVLINGSLNLDFILDTGASDVSVTPDVVLLLMKNGTLKENDFIGTQTYKFADGKTAKSKVFNLKNLKIGDFNLTNVRCTMSESINAPLLLGQSALKKLGKYSIDHGKGILIVE